MREQRDEARDEGGVLDGLDCHGEFHRGFGHFYGGFGAFVEGAVYDVGPVDEFSDGGCVESETGRRYVGEEAGAGCVVGVVEALAVVLMVEEVLMVGGREEGAEVMVEPPGDARGSGIFEVDDGVFVARKVGFVEKSTGAMDEAEGFVGGIAIDALAMEAGEEGRGAGSVETFVVIKDADFHLAASQFFECGRLRMLARGRSVKRLVDSRYEHRQCVSSRSAPSPEEPLARHPGGMHCDFDTDGAAGRCGGVGMGEARDACFAAAARWRCAGERVVGPGHGAPRFAWRSAY